MPVVKHYRASPAKAGWVVRKDGDKRPKASGLARKAAWLEACRLAKADCVSAFLVEDDGRVVARENYG